MKIPRINLALLSRFFIILAIILLLYNEFYIKSDSLALVSFICAFISVAIMVFFAIQIKRGQFNRSLKIVVETDVDRALKDGVITEEQAEKHGLEYVDCDPDENEFSRHYEVYKG